MKGDGGPLGFGWAASLALLLFFDCLPMSGLQEGVFSNCLAALPGRPPKRVRKAPSATDKAQGLATFPVTGLWPTA